MEIYAYVADNVEDRVRQPTSRPLANIRVVRVPRRQRPPILSIQDVWRALDLHLSAIRVERVREQVHPGLVRADDVHEPNEQQGVTCVLVIE